MLNMPDKTSLNRLKHLLNTRLLNHIQIIVLYMQNGIPFAATNNLILLQHKSFTFYTLTSSFLIQVLCILMAIMIQ